MTIQRLLVSITSFPPFSSPKYDFRRRICKSFYPIIMKRRWVLASVHNVCAAGGKPGTISVSVKSFMGIFLAIITGKKNAFVPRPEVDGNQAVHHWWNLGCFTHVKLSSDYPSGVGSDAH